MRVPLALFFFFFSYVCLFGHVCFYNRGRKTKKKRTFFLSCSPWILPGVLSHCRHKEPKRNVTRLGGEKKKKKKLFFCWIHLEAMFINPFSHCLPFLFLPETRRRRTKKEKREKINRFIVSKHKIRHRNEKIRKCRIGKNTKTLNSPNVQFFVAQLCVCV